jgi:hypothetical protein
VGKVTAGGALVRWSAGGGGAEISAAADAEAAPSLMRMQRRAMQAENRRDAWGTAALAPCWSCGGDGGVNGRAAAAAAGES